MTKTTLLQVAAGCLAALSAIAATTPTTGYEMDNEPTGEYYDWKQTQGPECPWLLPYHQTLVTKIFLCGKDPTGGVKKVYLTFEQALDVIRKLDHITCGIPKIVYLVGWQFDGHDSKYPSWAEVNTHLMRSQDGTAVESLRWLMREARQHHTIVSLHINMFDAYEDSPLWDTYVERDIVAKDKAGNVIFGEVHGGQRSSQISYTQEWRLGFAQTRIKGLLEMLPELKEARTIHIDAFHSCRPQGRGEPISPLLGYPMEQEAATQRKIYRYWRDLGLDVTSEGAAFLRPDPFIGLQPMAWANEEVVRELPDELYCSTPMRAEPEIMEDPENLPGLLEQFCVNVAPWHYDNHTDAPPFDFGSRAAGNVLVPALWREEPTLIAYSRHGYKNKEWRLPKDWGNVKQVAISRVTLDGPEAIADARVKKGRVRLTLDSGEGVLITD